MWSYCSDVIVFIQQLKFAMFYLNLNVRNQNRFRSKTRWLHWISATFLQPKHMKYQQKVVSRRMKNNCSVRFVYITCFCSWLFISTLLIQVMAIRDCIQQITNGNITVRYSNDWTKWIFGKLNLCHSNTRYLEDLTVFLPFFNFFFCGFSFHIDVLLLERVEW